MLIILLVSLVLGVLGGWLVPVLFKSPRPYGVLGDVLLCAAVTVLISFLSWSYIMPAMGFQDGWIKVAGATLDPFALGLISLWVLRKIKS
jgi:Na+-driven multidrug efflux pump